MGGGRWPAERTHLYLTIDYVVFSFILGALEVLVAKT
jgi:hypothetical protein